MKTPQLSSLVLLGSALLPAAALAQHPTGSSLRDKVHQDNDWKCLLYSPPMRYDDSWKDCMGVCGDAIKKQAQSGGKPQAISCIGVDVKYEKQPGVDRAVGRGNCTCSNSFIEWTADNVISALPAVAEIGCELLTTSASVILDLGSAFIPGGGEALDGGKIAIAEVAKTLKYTYGGTSKAFEAFNDWLNPCGDTSDVPDNLQQVFDTVNNWPDKLLPKGFKPNRKWKKGKLGQSNKLGKRDHGDFHDYLEYLANGGDIDDGYVMGSGVGGDASEGYDGGYDEGYGDEDEDYDYSGDDDEDYDDESGDYKTRAKRSDVGDTFKAIDEAEKKAWEKWFA